MRKQFGLIFGIGTILLTGCSQTLLDVRSYPTFFSSSNSYGSIAVAGAENYVEPDRYTGKLSSELIKGLQNNGYYAVIDYSHEKIDDSEMLAQLRDTSTADLALFSTLTDYGENYNYYIETETRERIIYAVDENGSTLYDDQNNAVIDHVEKYIVEHPVYEKTSHAALSVIIVDVKTGQAVYDAVKQKTCYEKSYNEDDISYEDAGRWCALSKAIDDHLHQICPNKEKVTANHDEILNIYRSSDNENWEKETKFNINDKMRLTFSFPEQAYYNTFTFDIVYGGDNILTYENLYWEGQEFVFEYDIASLVKDSNGESKYTIRIWNGDHIAFDKTIKVKLDK